MTTVLVFVFAISCLATFALGARKEWHNGRLISATVAILSFLMALVSASVK